MSNRFKALTVEKGVTIHPDSFWFPSHNVPQHGSNGHITANGWTSKNPSINFKDDFVGTNGSTLTVVPGYPWSTLGSDAVSIKSAAAAGGIWTLKTASTNKSQMNLFAGGTGQQLTGTMSGTLALQILPEDHRRTTENYYKGMTITRTGGALAGGSPGVAVIETSAESPSAAITIVGDGSDMAGTDNTTEYTIGPDEITTGGGSFQLRKNKDLIFRARFLIMSEVDLTHGFFIGLSSNTAKDLISDDCISYKPITSNIDENKKLSMYGFLATKHGDDKHIKCVAHNNDIPASGYTGELLTKQTGEENPTLEKNIWYQCRMVISNQGTSEPKDRNFSIKYELIKEVSPNVTYSKKLDVDDDRCKVTNQTPMAPAISIKHGANSESVPEYQIDYIECHQKR